VSHRILISTFTAVALGFALLSAAPVVLAQDDAVAGNASRLLAIATSVDESVSASDWDAARTGWQSFDGTWDDVEDGFRAVWRDGYRDVESHMSTIQRLLREDVPNADQLHAEISALTDLLTQFGASN